MTEISSGLIINLFIKQQFLPVMSLFSVLFLGYLACSRGRYGNNCSETCSNCEHKTCNPVSGVCKYDCKPGWKGDKCNQGIKFCIRYINGIFSSQEITQKCILWIKKYINK